MRSQFLTLRSWLRAVSCSGLLLAGARVVAAESQGLPFKVEQPDGMPFGAMTIFLVIVAALLMLLLALLRNKRTGERSVRWLSWLPAPQDNDALVVTASKRVTSKVSLHAIEWEGRKVLLAVSDQQIVRLDEIEIPAPPLRMGDGS